MSVDFVPASHVRESTRLIEAARQRVLDRFGVPPQWPDAAYWEPLFEATAAEVLAALPSVSIAAGYAVRYRFFDQRGRDLLVRPFVARASTDVDAIRNLIDWHPPPDATSVASSYLPTQDVELFYRHFQFPQTATGSFDYWLVMKELWASARGIHARVITTAEEFSQLTAAEGWQIVRPVEAYEPAVVLADGGARIAVLLYSPLGRYEITLQQIDVGADQSVRYAESVLVASGPRGYML